MEWAVIGVAAVKILLPFAITAGGYLATAAGNWLRAHANSTATRTALDVLTSITNTVVKELETTMVPLLRAKMEDGKLTGEDAEALRAQAIAVIKSYISQKGLNTVVGALKLDDTDLERFIGSKVEEAVYRVKNPGQDGLPMFSSSGGTAPVAGSAAALGRK